MISIQDLESYETFNSDDVFGIEIDFKINRAKFVYDTTVWHEFRNKIPFEIDAIRISDENGTCLVNR